MSNQYWYNYLSTTCLFVYGMQSYFVYEQKMNLHLCTISNIQNCVVHLANIGSGTTYPCYNWPRSSLLRVWYVLHGTYSWIHHHGNMHVSHPDIKIFLHKKKIYSLNYLYFEIPLCFWFTSVQWECSFLKN